MSAERFAPVMAPKVRGTWNLHVQTANIPLDFFVMFSSGAALLGSPGQASYAAACTFMDALAHWRRARGAHALSIYWGIWGGAGMASRVSEQHRRRWASIGFVTFEPEDGVRMLEALLYANRTGQAAAFPLVPGRIPTTAGRLFAALRAQETHAPGARPPASAGSTANVLASLTSARNGDRADLLLGFLTEQVVQVFDLGATQVDPQCSLMDLGMDSLMAMELRNRLQAALNVRVAVADLMGGPSLEALSAEILTTLEGNSEPQVASVEAWEECLL
jgi:myxalamid-type polyketide synthase MxaB